ncbi:hypothetical protein H5410_010121 [Solanum commersonii]|uniref:Mitochondrion protein n=1 Tax=Solanum commersonii TaxID=4109 RepID=A0A9J6ALK9_SOLCO|nr:hypothetical protein H5410_010121 [Solanum commersonii]
MAVVKRVVPLGVNYGISLSKLGGINNVAINVPAASLLVNRSQCIADGYNFKFYSLYSSKSSAHYKFDYRQMSQMVKLDSKRAFLVDTLAMVRRLEAQGVPSKQAEAITSAITEVLNGSLENIANSFVSLAEMQKSDLVQEANLSKFKSLLQNSQENHLSLLQHETEKFRNDIEKVRTELRYEIDKLTAGQRLDLNLERGSIRDELAKQSTGTTYLTNKLDREIHAMRAQLEAGKYEVIKYCIGSLVSISAVGLAVLRLYA